MRPFVYHNNKYHLGRLRAAHEYRHHCFLMGNIFDRVVPCHQHIDNEEKRKEELNHSNESFKLLHKLQR